MLEILESPKPLVAFRLSKELTAEDVDKSTKALTDALKDQERVNIFAEIDGSLKLTLEGLARDVANSVSNFGLRRKIYRLAVVSDSEVYKFLLRVEGLLFSSIEMRVFAPEDRKEALAWTSKEPEPLPKPEPPKQALRMLQTTNESVFAYDVDGRLTEKDIENVVRELKTIYEREEKVNILGRLTNYKGFDVSALLNDDLYRFQFQTFSKVDKYALIGAPAWMRNLLELVDPALRPKIKVFEPEDEQAAWDWVGASQALLTGSSE